MKVAKVRYPTWSPATCAHIHWLDCNLDKYGPTSAPTSIDMRHLKQIRLYWPNIFWIYLVNMSHCSRMGNRDVCCNNTYVCLWWWHSNFPTLGCVNKPYHLLTCSPSGPNWCWNLTPVSFINLSLIWLLDQTWKILIFDLLHTSGLLKQMRTKGHCCPFPEMGGNRCVNGMNCWSGTTGQNCDIVLPWY